MSTQHPLQQLKLDPWNTEAILDLRRTVDVLLRKHLKGPRTAEDMEDLSSDAVLRLIVQVQGGNLKVQYPGEAYNYTERVVLSVISQFVKQRERVWSPPAPPVGGEEEESIDPQVPRLPGQDHVLQAAEAERIIGQLRAVTRARRKPRYQADFDEALRVAEALMLEGYSPLEILEDRGCNTDDPATLKRARDALYQQQSRLRAELLTTLDLLLADGTWTEDEAEVVREYTLRMFRCQRQATEELSEREAGETDPDGDDTP